MASTWIKVNSKDFMVNTDAIKRITREPVGGQPGIRIHYSEERVDEFPFANSTQRDAAWEAIATIIGAIPYP